MTDNVTINETLLQMKYARIIHLLAVQLNIEEPQALELFYASDTYRHLSDRRNQLHNMSDAYVVDGIITEQEQSPLWNSERK